MTYTKEDALQELREIQQIEETNMYQDCEYTHESGDAVLCKLLLAYDCAEVVQAWKKLRKWYA